MNDKATAETARIRSALICLPLIVDEQGERIKEAVKEYWENQELVSLQEFEDMFEDRDPFEFL
tara:strand:+ start:75 stop:263 length:189 start_codon:yes stop_codon:yes gene_type:complete